ncbi:MAG: ComE operon protein 1 [Tenericutes bacterium ADurb.BinA155]|jgi:competence protein ComEA|nr:MAG: ComE operon protein 1 [Tenericutes bacterium ADurb.BinA155]
MYKIIIVVLIVTVISIVAFSALENVSNSIVSSDVSSITSNKDAISITITGEVTRPGTYVCDIGATLAAVLKKASGATSNADPLAYNTDYVCEDGMSFYIAPIYDNGDTCAVTPISKQNINTADKATLMEIPGFGDAIATSLLSYRTSTALFNRLEEIKNVPGIGEATFTKARDHMTIKETA